MLSVLQVPLCRWSACTCDNTIYPAQTQEIPLLKNQAESRNEGVQLRRLIPLLSQLGHGKKNTHANAFRILLLVIFFEKHGDSAQAGAPGKGRWF